MRSGWSIYQTLQSPIRAGMLAGCMSLLAIGLQQHNVNAAGTWSDPGTSTFNGSASANTTHRPWPNCFNPMVMCLDPNPPIPPIMGFIPNFFGFSYGRIAEAECRFASGNGCYYRGIADAQLVVGGIGADEAEVRWWLDAETDNLCECPFNGAGEIIHGVATFNTTIDLQIQTVPAGQPVTVFFSWWAVVNRWTDHEAGGEDPARIENVTLSVQRNNDPPVISITPPMFDVNAMAGTPNNISFLPPNPVNATGSFAAMGGDIIKVTVAGVAEATIQPPPIDVISNKDHSWAHYHGQILLNLDHAPPAVQNPLNPGGSVNEFSLDIGSDSELSDPSVEGNETFDPGDTYPWFGPALPVGGSDGVRDDTLAFQTDFWPDAPDGPPPATGAQTCLFALPLPPGLGDDRFDLDGTDALEAQLRFLINPDQPLLTPITPADLAGQSGCLYYNPYLLISWTDDGAAHYGWNFCDVPSEVPSDRGFTYGSDLRDDEVVMLTTSPNWPPAPGLAPVQLGAVHPIVSEASLHVSLSPSVDPAVGQQRDDDVDGLDVNVLGEQCDTWYISADHEATGLHPAIPGLPLDPADIYEVLALGGLTKVIDHAIHLGLPDGTDIDAFEFVWLRQCSIVNPINCQDVLALLFSVDQDDFLTGPDESGGLDPAMIYASLMNGTHFEYLSDATQDNIDAIAASPLPFVPAGPAIPANNDCLNRILVGPGQIAWNSCGATADGPIEPCGFDAVTDTDIWYEFIMPCNGTWTVQSTGSAMDHAVAVYNACPQIGGVSLGCAQGPVGGPAGVTGMGVAGESFVVRVGGLLGQCGPGTLDITIACSCPWDIATSGGPGQDGQVNVFDLFLLLSGWNTNGPGADLAPPVNNIDVFDLFEMLSHWGACP